MERELTERGEDRKSQLLEHAAHLFQTRGYADTRVTDIAAAAGVAKGLLYWYFPSKEAILTELVDDVQSRLRRLQGDALYELDDPLERLYLGTTVTVRFVAEHFHLYGEIARATAGQPDPPVARMISRHAADTTAVIRDGQRRSVMRTDETPEALAYAVSAIVNELVRFHHLGLLPGGVDDTAALAARTAAHLVAADPAQVVALTTAPHLRPVP
jgi:AcrR family transcriptional regulator